MRSGRSVNKLYDHGLVVFAMRKAACAQSFAPWQQATIEIMHCNLSSYCLLALHTYIFILRVHPIRGELHNQRNTTGEVATTSPPFVYNEPHRLQVLC